MRTNILLLLAILVSVIILSSCGDKAKIGENTIVGEWVYSSMATDIETSDPEATAKIISVFEENNDGSRSLDLEFTNDGKMISSKNESGTYSISENKLVLTVGNDSDTNEFVIKGDTLSIIASNPDLEKQVRKGLNINDSVRIEKLILITSFVRKK